jgi:triosephosphate isomerase
VLCIGESIKELKNNITHEILEQQIIEVLTGSVYIKSLIIAYEPIWAIGSGQTPTPKEINSVHEMIKDVVQSRFPKTGLESVIYGGSVNKSNALDLFEQKNIDGALIGGASLDGKDFALIANIFNKLKV